MKAMHVWLVIRMEKNKRNCMRYLLIIFFLFFIMAIGASQGNGEWHEGSISFSNSQNVYVNFKSTGQINPGDTLFVLSENEYSPALIVQFKSSISCVCKALDNRNFEAESLVYFRQITEKGMEAQDEPEKAEKTIAESKNIIKTESEEDSLQFQQELRGRFSVSSYTNMEGFNELSSQRMRYAFSLSGQHVGGSRFSLQNYIVFRHRFDQPIKDTDGFFDALKIYNLAAGYQLNNRNELWLGRRINNHITNIGAIDGIQYAHQINKFSIGGFVGTRPDYSDYRITTDLPQAGIYLAFENKGNKGTSRSTLSFVEQRNSGVTDRRFLYFQHSGTLLKNLHLFSSFELDMYTVDQGNAGSALIPTSLYVSLRYRPILKLSIFGSYDNRRRVIYYESYKNIIDQLLEEETRQGFRLRIQYRMLKRLSIGASGMYRMQLHNTPTRNLYGYITLNRIPGLKINSTISYNYLESSYLQGTIIGFRANRDLIRGKLSSSFQYRYVDYTYNASETKLIQQIGGINLSWRISRDISMSFNYEGSFQADRNYNRIYVNAVKRFR